DEFRAPAGFLDMGDDGRALVPAAVEEHDRRARSEPEDAHGVVGVVAGEANLAVRHERAGLRRDEETRRPGRNGRLRRPAHTRTASNATHESSSTAAATRYPWRANVASTPGRRTAMMPETTMVPPGARSGSASGMR